MPDPNIERPDDGGEWLIGGGAMGDLVRATDWSATPLGPRAGWPQSLRTAVDVALSSRIPMAILWSTELLFVYNDGYREIAGGKHPDALGRSTRDVWPEVWEFNRPVFERVMERGETVYLEDQLFAITRNGEPEDAYFTLCYSPIRTEAGAVGGTLVTLLETTRRVRLERQLTLEKQTLESQVRATLLSIPDEVWIVDAEGRVVLASEAVKPHLGVTPDHWGDIHAAIADLEIFEPDGAPRPPERAPIARSLKGEVLTAEREVIRHLVTGELRWREVSSAPVHEPGGRVTGAVCVVRDVTERVRIEEALRASEARLRAMFESLAEGVVFLNPQGLVAQANEAVERVFGYALSELTDPTNDPRFRAVRGDGAPFPPEEQPAMLALSTGEAVRDVEIGIRRPDGAVAWHSANAQPVRDDRGNLLGAVASFFDVTDRKRMEDSLRRAKEEAEAASRAKDQFLAVVSHELRTPLNPILAIASYLHQKPDLPPDLREDVATIRRNVEQEARLVDDLLNLTRLKRGKIELHQEAVDIHILLRAVVGQYQPQMDEKGVDLLVSLRARPHTVWADPGRMQQVLSNILDNAVKFTPAGGCISVRSSVTPEGRVRVEVADTGTGIAPEVLRRLFRPFEQGESTTTRRYGGLGLGLVIARGIMDLHGGTIAAASPGAGQGAVLTLEMDSVPAVEPPPSAPPAAHDRERDESSERRRLLLLEDHPDTLKAISRLLKAQGYEVLTATSVREAMEAVEREEFDLLVSDIGLPDGSGLDVMRELKRLRNGKGIALSGFGHEEDVRLSSEAGFARHIVKPVNFDQLNRVLNELLG